MDLPHRIRNLIDTSSQTIQLCIQGTQAEYQGRPAEAKTLYSQAWKAANNNIDRCVAAHYVARFQDTPAERFQWNKAALDYANAADGEQVKGFYPSLYLNLGHSFEELGNQVEAEHYYALATRLGSRHNPDHQNT